MNRVGWRWSIVPGLVLAAGCSGIDDHRAELPPALAGQTAALDSEMQTVWLVLRDQADLAPARGMRDWRARGEMVFDQLTRTAALSQGALRAWLRSRGIEHQPFWIVNAIKVRVPAAVVRLLGNFPEVAAIRPDRAVALPPTLEGREEPGGTPPSGGSRTSAPPRSGSGSDSGARAWWWPTSTPGSISTTRP